MLTNQLGAPRDSGAPERYFTDGVNLYRLVGWLERPDRPPLVELEDCRSLSTTLLEREELEALALLPVAVGVRS